MLVLLETQVTAKEGTEEKSTWYESGLFKQIYIVCAVCTYLVHGKPVLVSDSTNHNLRITQKATGCAHTVLLLTSCSS